MANKSSQWPSPNALDSVKKKVIEMSGGDCDHGDVRVVVSPYRICPLGAHIDHQGGVVTAMTINMGILLAFRTSDDTEIWIKSAQFDGEVRFRVDEPQSIKRLPDEPDWTRYARGAVYALQSKGFSLSKGLIGFICGSDEHSSGLSSSAAVGIAYLLAFESANGISVSPEDNIDLGRIIENEFLCLKSGILDQSAVLLSKKGYLTWIDCKTREHGSTCFPKMYNGQEDKNTAFKILLAFSGLKEPLTKGSGYNTRVSECREAAKALLCTTENENVEPLLCNVDSVSYESKKGLLKPNLAKRAEHYFSENRRVSEGLKAWSCGNLEDFGKLISASGRSSIESYESGCKELIELYEILLKAPGVFGARFSGAGFRGCCIAFVDATQAEKAADYVKQQYQKLEPSLASKLHQDRITLICEPEDCARVM